MVGKPRKRITQHLVDEVLFRSNHTCCICRTKGKDVQIHHIDGNRSNNGIGNLAVVCLDCHSKVTGRRGLGQSYSPGEVRKYKRSWEQAVLDLRQVHRPQIRYKKELVSQIDLIICDILARKQNSSRVEELLNVLFELHLWRGGPEIDSKIVEGLHHIALMSGLSSPRIAAIVAEKLWEMCFHFVGPEDVDMDKKNQKYVLKCVDALETLGQFNSEFGHGRKAAQSIAESAENFFEIALWYDTKRVANAVLRGYEKTLRGCYEYGKLEFSFGRTVLRRSLRKIRRLLNEQHPQWKYQLQRIDKLLAI
jgi:hypothetical protein